MNQLLFHTIMRKERFVFQLIELEIRKAQGTRLSATSCGPQWRLELDVTKKPAADQPVYTHPLNLEASAARRTPTI